MKSLSIALTCVFVTLKLTGNIAWGWFWVVCPIVLWVALACIINFAYGFTKALKKAEEDEKKEHRSKWQQRLDEIRAVREHNKMLIAALVICAALYSCRPAQNVTACPKPFSGKFNK